MFIVQKFGGSSVANAERIMNVAKRIKANYVNGDKIVVVVSAQGDTTDDLIEKSKEITKNASKREMDMLLATGEQQSAALLTMALQELNCPAISLNGMQVGIIASSAYGNARIRRIEKERINLELDRKNIVIIAGFQGVNRYGDITTLGRGASDTTAVALTATLCADKCEIYTDVNGIYTADPRIVKSAIKLDEITYDEMLELASLGANVLHNRAVEMAKKYNVDLIVRSSLTHEKGTLIREELKMESMLVSGVAIDKDVCRISVVGIKDTPGMAFKLFSLLSKNKISIDIILQSIGRDNSKDITFTVSKSNQELAISVLNDSKDILNFNSVSYDDNIAKLSIVGAGMATNPGVASLMFEALYDANININMISTSEIKISVLVDEKDAERGTNAIHDKFMGATIDINK